MVPPCCGCGWQTRTAWFGSRSSGSSSSASSFPAGPSMNRLSIRRGMMGTGLVGAVVGELHVDAEVFTAQQRDHFLQRVAIFARDPHQVALDGRLHLLLAVFNHFHNLARLFGGNALLQRDFLANAGPGGGRNGAVSQAF